VTVAEESFTEWGKCRVLRGAGVEGDGILRDRLREEGCASGSDGRSNASSASAVRLISKGDIDVAD
jgi:hypothetical protein